MPEHEKPKHQRPVVEQVETDHETQVAPVQGSLTKAAAPSMQPRKIATLQRLIGNRATRSMVRPAPAKAMPQPDSLEHEFTSDEWVPVDAAAESAGPEMAAPPAPPPPTISNGALQRRIQREGGDTPPPKQSDEKDGFLKLIPPSSNSRYMLLSEVTNAVAEEEKISGRKGLAAKTAYIIVTSAIYAFDSSGSGGVSVPIKPDTVFPGAGYYLSVRGYPTWKVLSEKAGVRGFRDFTLENAAESQMARWMGADGYAKLKKFIEGSGSDGIIMVVNPGQDIDDGDTGEHDGDAGNEEWAKSQVKQVGGMISRLRKEAKERKLKEQGKGDKDEGGADGGGGSGGKDEKSDKHVGDDAEDKLPDGVWHQSGKGSDGKQYIIITVDGALRRLELLDDENPVKLLKRIEEATRALRKARDASQSVMVANGAKTTGMTGKEVFGDTGPGEQPPTTGFKTPAIVGKEAGPKPNAPPYPANIINYGPDTTVIGATNRFSMELDFALAGSDMLSQVTARMQPIRYYWELIDVTNVNPEAHQAVAEKTSIGSNQAVRATSGPMADLERDLKNAGEDTLADLKDLTAHPETALLNWQARAAWLGVIAVSNVVQMGGSLISSYVSLVSTPLNERSIGFAKEGDYIIRCVASPVPSDRVPEDKRIVRAPSVRAIPIRVQKVNTRAQETLDQKPEDIAAMEKKLAEMKDGDEKVKLQAMLKQRQNENTPEAVNRQLKATEDKLRVLYDLEMADREQTPRAKRTVESRLLDVQLQLMNIPRDEYRRGLLEQSKQLSAILDSTVALGDKIEGANYRPDVVLASEENGQVIRMLMMLGEAKGSKDGKRVYNLIDVTSPKTRGSYEGRSSKTGNDGHAEAIRNAFVNFRENNGYGRGTLALKLPQKLHDDLGFEVPLDGQMRSAPGTLERAMSRLRDLATAAEIAGMILSGPVGLAVGTVGGVAGAITAIHSMSKRANGERLEWDFQTGMEILAIVGGAVSLAQAGSFVAGQTKRFAKTAQKVDGGLHIVGVGLMAGQVVLIPTQLILELKEIDEQAEAKNMSPGEIAAARAEALLGAVKAGVVTVISAGGGFGYDPLAPKSNQKGKAPSEDIPEAGPNKPAETQTPEVKIPEMPPGPVPRELTGQVDVTPDVKPPTPDAPTTTAPKPATPAKPVAPGPALSQVSKSNLMFELNKVLGADDLPKTGRVRISDNLDAQWQEAKGSPMPADVVGYRDPTSGMLYLDSTRMTAQMRDVLTNALKQKSRASKLARAALGDAVCDAFQERMYERLISDPQYTPPAKDAAVATADVLLSRLEGAAGVDAVADALLHGTMPGLRSALSEKMGAARANAIEALIKSGQYIRAAVLLDPPNNTARSAYGEAFSAGVEDLMAADAGAKPRNPERLAVMREIAGIVGVDALTMALLKGEIAPVRAMLEKAIGKQFTEQLIAALTEGNLPRAKKSLQEIVDPVPDPKAKDAKPEAEKGKKPKTGKKGQDKQAEAKTEALPEPAKDPTAQQPAQPDATAQEAPKPKASLGPNGTQLADIVKNNTKGDHGALAESVIKEAGSFKKLREMVRDGLFGNSEANMKLAQKLLQDARVEMTTRVMQEIVAQVQKKYPGMEITLEDMGTPGFGSDRDITAKADGQGVPVNQKVQASAEVVDLAYQKLRELGLDPDTVLDSNFYTELHEGKIKASSPEEARAIAYDQSVVSMAEQRMQMDDAQWQAFRERQLASLPAVEKPTGSLDVMQQQARQRVEQQLNSAEAMVESRLGGNGTSSAAERKMLNEKRLKLLEARRAELREMMGRTPPATAREIRALMAEVKMLEPDAYGTRAAKEGVVDTQQAMARGETWQDAADVWDRRQRQKRAGTRAEMLQRLAQEASASLAKMYGHAKPYGNSASDARALAKYLGRVYHAFQEAGLGGMKHPFIDKTGSIVASKHEAAADAATLTELRTWAQDVGMTNVTDAQLIDRFVAEAQKLGNDITARLRAAEAMDHVFEYPGDIMPKQLEPTLWSDAAPSPQSPQQGELLAQALRGSMQKPTVHDPELKKHVDANYRENAKIGSGSTADAIRHERSTGQKVGEKEHTQKGQDTINGLRHWLDTHPLDHPDIKTAEQFSQRKNDRIAAENIIRDIEDALKSPELAKPPEPAKTPEKAKP
jgi:hypothetical protein